MIERVGLYSQPKIQEQISKNIPTSVSVGNVSFKGNEHLPAEYAQTQKELLGKTGMELAYDFVKENEIRVPNLLDLQNRGKISLARSDMRNDKEKDLNPSGIEFSTRDIKNSTVYDKELTIKNQLQPPNTLAVVKFNSKDTDLPILTYKQGKYMPEITVKHKETLKGSYKMLAGSVHRGNGYEIVMPGNRKDLETGKIIKVAIRELDNAPVGNERRSRPSFTGRLAVTTLYKEEKTRESIDKYYADKLYEQAIKGDYINEMVENDPTIVIPAGGQGERFRNLTRDRENKPSNPMPTSDGYRVIASALNMAAGGGMILGKDKDDLTYISQSGDIKGSNVKYTSSYKSDGGAISEALARDIIPNDKDVVVLNADIFTNADVTRAYHALKTLPDAALVIPYYPVDGNRAKALGLLGVEKDGDNLQIKEFVEKSPYTSEPPRNTDFSEHGDYDKALRKFDAVQMAKNDKGEFLANPGIYLLSKEAAKVLMSAGIMDPTMKKAGLGNDVMPHIVQMCKDGRLKTADGKPMKVYTVPLETKSGKPAYWNDIGTAEEFLSVVRDVAVETKRNGTGHENKYYGIPTFVLEDFRDNVCFKTGMVFDSKESRKNYENYAQQKGVDVSLGNIYVTKNKK